MHTSMKTGLQFALIVCVLCLGGTAYANSPQTHDGFLLRLSLGPGFATTSIDDGDASVTYSGGSGDINIAIGGMVSESLAVHGTIGGWNVFEPDVELAAGNITLGGRADDATLSLSTVGAGVTTYFASNLYFSGSLGFAALTAEEGEESSQSETGISVDLTLGKEWWASSNWGLGVSGGLGLHSIPVENSDDTFSGASLGLRFSATFN